MPRLHGRSSSTRYHTIPAPRQLGPCQEPAGCPGTLQLGSLNDELIITCTVCPATWPRDRWIELAQLLEAVPA